MSDMVMAGIAKLVWAAAERRGIPRAELLEAAALAPSGLPTSDALIPRATEEALLRMLIQRIGDPAIGIALAREFDLKTMGFWGYALMSALTVRQRIQLHLHYQRLLNPEVQASFRVESDRAVIEFIMPKTAPDLAPVLVDCAFAITCMQQAKLVGVPTPDVELWLMYPELPHHAELRALTRSQVHFNAPQFRIAIPASELNRRLPGDVHLLELAKTQLDAQLSKIGIAWGGDVRGRVRRRISARLAGDASLEVIARDLQVSARTLRRQLNDAGVSFQVLLEETRLSQAIDYLVDGGQAIKHVAAQLGYRDPSNFRRAFRRWTGATPASYRAGQRARVEHALADNDGSPSQMPLSSTDD